jgi:hypothetical protein
MDIASILGDGRKVSAESTSIVTHRAIRADMYSCTGQLVAVATIPFRGRNVTVVAFNEPRKNIQFLMESYFTHDGKVWTESGEVLAPDGVVAAFVINKKFTLEKFFKRIDRLLCHGHVYTIRGRKLDPAFDRPIPTALRYFQDEQFEQPTHYGNGNMIYVVA